METRFGYMDLKTSPVHFYVQRSNRFSKKNSPITFELERLNIGGAMNIKTGIFTAPRNGVYHFDFSFLKDVSQNFVTVFLRKNGVNIGATEASGSANFDLQSSLHSTLKLDSGDKVDLFEVRGGVIIDDPDHYTHFTGWLIEEDLIIPNWRSW